MHYRKEIDGLRAIAVLPVILFHGGLGLTGGYVGVDIFFVISGYLITSIILEDLTHGRFSIINFYERRARRILPALSIVVAVTTVAALILLPPMLMKGYAQSVVSVATFSSNIYFYLTSGYFDTAADEKPLLHTWSLAVEEQFYLLFPLLLMLIYRFGIRIVAILLASITFVSLMMSGLLSRSMPDFTFYLLPARAWELF
ncbi:MAG: acyltransferase, partial [Gammaproteobacteria bacterium]|nr:acyltransferase [Gammaproteobacteria bacterium]